MSAMLLVDYPNPIHEYRKNMSTAMNEFICQIKKIETVLEDINRFDREKQIQSKYYEVIKKMKQLTTCLDDFDNLLYEYQKKLQEFEDMPVGLNC